MKTKKYPIYYVGEHLYGLDEPNKKPPCDGACFAHKTKPCDKCKRYQGYKILFSTNEEFKPLIGLPPSVDLSNRKYTAEDIIKLSEDVRERVLYYNDDILAFRKWFLDYKKKIKIKPVSVELEVWQAFEDVLENFEFVPYPTKELVIATYKGNVNVVNWIY